MCPPSQKPPVKLKVRRCSHSLSIIVARHILQDRAVHVPSKTQRSRTVNNNDIDGVVALTKLMTLYSG